MQFFGTGRTYQITATHFPPEGEIFNDRRDVQRFVFWDERDYRKKKVELSEDEYIESVYCVETETTTIFMKGEKQK